jgi:4-amino-4-deoxy-L-arabinose transferase-like glycosyltransferase
MSAVIALPSRTRPRALRWPATFAEGVIEHYWWFFNTIMAVMTWNVLWRLGYAAIQDCDEARYGVAASEMLHAHSPLITTYAGATEFWNLKPPLGYWLLDLSYKVFGETPFALRLPAALSSVIVVALTMVLARRMAGAGISILSGLVLATSFGFLGHHGARSGELDMHLTLLALLLLTLSPHLTQSRQARLGAGLVLALAFLLKSFAILPYVAAAGCYCLMTRGLRSWRAWLLPAGIALVVAVTWVIARSVAEGSWEFAQRMFVEDLILRSTTMIDEGKSGTWDYVGGLFDRLAPWPLVVLAAVVLCRRFATRRLTSDMATLLWLFALTPAILFTLIQTHHFWYIIPTYPAWSILAAAAIMECLERAESSAPRTALVVLAVLMVACEVRVAVHTARHEQMPASQIFLASLHKNPGQTLRVAFVPTYSERFLLQVVDGYTLVEDTRDATLQIARKGDGYMLHGNSE